MKLQNFKSLFLKSLIGCLIAAAALAVVTILIGQFNDICAKALFTILLIALHCLVSFSFIVNNEKQDTFDSLAIFANATFMIIVFSFATSILGVWGVIGGELVFKLYAVYFILLFATLHGEILAKTLGKQANIDNIVYANFIFMVIVVLMLMPVIFVGDNNTLGAVYYRLLAACGVIDATLTLIAVILHKLYIQKHPTIKDNVFNLQPIPGQPGQYVQASAPQPRRGMNIFVVLLIIYVVLQLACALFIGVIGAVAKN
ncbi:MAG: hypothetical protein AAB971_00810 [Patescibacteria group bacterium]